MSSSPPLIKNKNNKNNNNNNNPNEEKNVISIEGIDSVVRTVLQKFVDRAEMGKQKYGVTLDRTDLSVVDWIKHAQEEHMDAILYLEKLKQVLPPTEMS